MHRQIKHEPANPKGTIIWLHGLGDNASDFQRNVFFHLSDKVKDNFISIFPDAPLQPVTINGGMVMSSWYDILSLDKSGSEDERGILDAAKIINKIIGEQSTDHRVASNIILVGFSQGGGVALHTAFNCLQELSGIVLCSSYVPIMNCIERNNSGTNSNVEILFMHGINDDVIPIEMMEIGYNHLINLNYNVDLIKFSHGHSVSEEQVSRINSYLEGKVP